MASSLKKLRFSANKTQRGRGLARNTVVNNRLRLLRIFFDDPLPEHGFQLRELSRLISLAPKSLKSYLAQFEKEGFILIKRHRVTNYPLYYANRDNSRFRLLKKLDMVQRLHDSGFLVYLNDYCQPNAVVLFGSASRGEDIKGSDIDLFVECIPKKLALARYESALCRKLSVFFEASFNNLSIELKNNILNGIILSGYLEVFKDEPRYCSRYSRQRKSKIHTKNGRGFSRVSADHKRGEISF